MRNSEKNKIFNNMKNLLNETKLEKKENNKSEINKEDIKELINIDVFKDITNDEKIIELFLNSSIELFQIQAKNAIELGRVFKNVFDELGGEGSKNSGLYEKWLLVNNISKSTALRYRKRYELYMNLLPENRRVATLLSQKYIDVIYLEENKEKYIELINSGATSKEVAQIIESQNFIEIEKEKKNTQKPGWDYVPKFMTFSDEVMSKICKLDEKDKKHLEKYLKKIEKILD